PGPPSFLLDDFNMLVAWARGCVGGGAEHRRRPRRDDHRWRRLRLAYHHSKVDGLGIVGTIGPHGSNHSWDLFEQGADHREIADLLARQLRSKDLAALR